MIVITGLFRVFLTKVTNNWWWSDAQLKVAVTQSSTFGQQDASSDAFWSSFLSFWHLILYSEQYHVKYISTCKVNTCLMMFSSWFISEKICMGTELFPVIYGKTVDTVNAVICDTLCRHEFFSHHVTLKSEYWHVVKCSTWQNITYSKKVLISLVLQKGDKWIYWLYELTKWRI